ncbi:hypothetical protein FKW77_009412 [Venturia effusa]|uniref:Hydrophobin n=1 Tax=Venturia effusa TaxID=50376 RepID=A0A517LG93_9PEZI|nr:hypothetical protein FKW77_009412 [Venturia effusa]
MWDRILLTISLLFASISASMPGSDNPFLPFDEPYSPSNGSIDNATLPHLNLLKRQSSACPSGSNSCQWLNSASNLCCRGTALCSADAAGHIACCPQGSVCTGTISGIAATATSTGLAGVVLTTSTAGLLTTTVGQNSPTSSVIILGGTTAASAGPRSYVSNSFFPFPYIPTTYANALACSTAYTSCQRDVASCTDYLGGGSGMGVTISVSGGGGTTVAAPTTTYASAFASSICSSLSAQACYSLTVEACGNFGSGTPSVGHGARRTGMPYVGAGVGFAVGALAFQ